MFAEKKMKLAEKSQRKIEEFFRTHLADDEFILPEIHFYNGKLTHLLTSMLKIEGITIGKRIYILPKNFWLSESRKLRLDEELAVHEITHVLQYRRVGFLKFFRIYLNDYFSNLRRKKSWSKYARAEAYFEIPFEIEARRTASIFAVWSSRRKSNKYEKRGLSQKIRVENQTGKD